MGTRFIDASDSQHIPSTADVVIIGGGPAGTAAAWALYRRDPTLSVVLIEKSERLGAGSSTASLEAFRTCWPCVPLARQMQRSIEVFLKADEYLGEGASQTIAVKQNGYLFCAFNDTQVDGFRADIRRLQEIGITHVELLEGDALESRFGWLGEQVIAAKFDPRAGWLDSNALIHCYIASTPYVQVVFGVQQIEICVEASRVIGVSTPQFTIAAPKVLIAAGGESRRIARTAGVDLPVLIRPRQSFTTGWRHPEFPSDAPLLISGPPYPHVRPEAQIGATFGWEYAWNNRRHGTSETMLPDPPDSFAHYKDARFPSLTLALLARQFGHKGGGFADLRYLRGVHHNIGCYVYRDAPVAYHDDYVGTTRPYESERAIIDRHPELDGLVVSVAHVGHGIMSSPCSGEIAAAHLLNQPLSDPSFSDFGFAAHWVEYDKAVL